MMNAVENNDLGRPLMQPLPNENYQGKNCVKYSTPTNERVAQPVKWRNQPVTSVIELLFKSGGTWAQSAETPQVRTKRETLNQS